MPAPRQIRTDRTSTLLRSVKSGTFPALRPGRRERLTRRGSFSRAWLRLMRQREQKQRRQRDTSVLGPGLSCLKRQSISMLQISVILPLLDHRGYALECVRAWTQGQTFPGDDYEVLVVGNGSEPRLEAAVAALLRPQDRFVRHATDNEMELCDAGARQAHGPWLLFTEPHCVAHPDCLRELHKFLTESDFDGACLRTIDDGNRQLLARLEGQMYRHGFAQWSRPDNWRKVHKRGAALRRSVYEQVGGLDYRYGYFAELALAAKLHHQGFRLGHAAGAGVKHFDSTSFHHLFLYSGNFSRGEGAYRDQHDPRYCDRYFGPKPEWALRAAAHPSMAREAFRAVWRTLGDALRHSHQAANRSLACSMARRALRSLPQMIFGPRIHLARARLAVLRAQVRLLAFSANEDARFRNFLRMWDLMASYGRIQYAIAHPLSTAVFNDQSLRVDVETVDSEAVPGFHAREVNAGRAFRWTRAVAVLPAEVAAGDYDVALQVLPLRGPARDLPLRLFWNGHKLRRVNADDQHEVVYRIEAGMFTSRPTQYLALTCQPVRRDRAEGRELGVPLTGIELRPRTERDVRPGPTRRADEPVVHRSALALPSSSPTSGHVA